MADKRKVSNSDEAYKSRGAKLGKDGMVGQQKPQEMPKPHELQKQKK